MLICINIVFDLEQASLDDNQFVNFFKLKEATYRDNERK